MDRDNNTLEEIKQLSLVAEDLIKYLDPEPKFVRNLVEEVVRRLLEEGKWTERYEDGRPWIKTLEKKEYTLRIGIIHARKGEHVTGADLVFELRNNKIIFVQSKRVRPNGRLIFNRFQLLKLMELEIGFNLRRSPIFVPPWRAFCLLLPFKRAAFYHLIMRDQSQIQEKFFHISEIMYTLGNRKSVSQDEFINMGLTLTEFTNMFWNCEVGAPDINEKMKMDILYLYSLVTGRIILWLDIEKK